MKATGEGFSLPLDRFDVSLAPGEPARLLDVVGRPGEVARWSMRRPRPRPGLLRDRCGRGDGLAAPMPRSRVRSRQSQGFRRNLSVPVLERALSSSAEGWELGAGGVFSAVGRCLTEPPPLRKGRLQGQGDGACLRRRTLVGARLDLPDSSSSVPLILRWVALILPRPQALREPRGRVGGRRVWDGAGSGRLGWGRNSIIQIYTTASFDADFHGRENNQSLRAQGPSFLGDLPHRATLWLIVFSAQSGSVGFVSTFSIS